MLKEFRKHAGKIAGAVCLAFAFTTAAMPDDAFAKPRKKTHQTHKKASTKKKSSAPAYNPPKAYIVVEAKTGRVLAESESNTPRFPASLTKMMTVLLTFDAINQGKLKLDQIIPVSDNAASYPPTKLCKAETNCGEIKVETAIKALIVKSANDIAVALAENVAGSHPAFVAQMNAKAKELGMESTVFKNANGLPHPEQVTTADDMAVLARALVYDYSKYYKYFDLRTFDYNGRTIKGHNRLVSQPGVDGLKTGYINASGFNIATSAERGGKRVTVIYFGGASAKARDWQVQSLLNKGFQILRRDPGTKPATSPK